MAEYEVTQRISWLQVAEHQPQSGKPNRLTAVLVETFPSPPSSQTLIAHLQHTCVCIYMCVCVCVEATSNFLYIVVHMPTCWPDFVEVGTKAVHRFWMCLSLKVQVYPMTNMISTCVRGWPCIRNTAKLKTTGHHSCGVHSTYIYPPGAPAQDGHLPLFGWFWNGPLYSFPHLAV